MFSNGLFGHGRAKSLFDRRVEACGQGSELCSSFRRVTAAQDLESRGLLGQRRERRPTCGELGASSREMFSGEPEILREDSVIGLSEALPGSQCCGTCFGALLGEVRERCAFLGGFKFFLKGLPLRRQRGFHLRHGSISDEPASHENEDRGDDQTKDERRAAPAGGLGDGIGFTGHSRIVVWGAARSSSPRFWKSDLTTG